MARSPLTRRWLPLGSHFFCLALLAAPTVSAATLILTPQLRSGPIQFAADEISAAIVARGETVEHQTLGESIADDGREVVILATVDLPCVSAAVRSGQLAPIEALQPEGFSVRVRGGSEGPRTIWIVGHDTAGTMYGGLEVAELIRLQGRGAVAEVDRHPHLAERGVKFNLPLDARSPSYSDASDTAQENIGTVWQIEFWREFIDHLARNRYNLISLWNLHPFPSLVRVPEYPEIALADVQRSRGGWKEHHALQATGLDAPELLAQVETLRHLSIDEKIAFWREVMRYGRERNVKFYLITWNIFTNGTDGKYGLTPARDNPVTADYFRRSVRELLLTYPDLAGIGFTAGENMPDATAAEKEDWAFRTYGQGILDALAAEPTRKVTFIHRQHEAAAAEIARQFAPLLAHPGVDFVYSFKYAEAHVLSSTRQTFHEKFLADIGAAPLWTLRNDDNYFFRWGAPDFVREFIQQLPAERSRGFYYGSDQWIWGRDFLDLTRNPSAPRPLELAKHWYHWLLWGRLGYDASLGDDRIVALLGEHFPRVDARALFAAWQEASMVYPLTTGFHWGALDFQWYIEGCQSRPEPAQTPTGFHDINRFITLRPHPATDNLSIPDYVAAVRAGTPPAGTTPLQVAERLQAHAARAHALVDALTTGDDGELRHTTEDIRAMAHLGAYYGHKIRAATHLALGRATLEAEHPRVVAAELNQAAFHWRSYASHGLARYRNPVWMARVGHVDWRRTYASVIHDLTSTGSPVAIPSMQPTPGGTILEAENAATNGVPARDAVAGFTGTGYLDFNRAQGTRWVEWTYAAPADGNYLLEIRYAMRPWGMRDGDRGASPLTINGVHAGELVLWGTGGLQTWAWDRKSVRLVAGNNTIRLLPQAMPNIDHLNVMPLAKSAD